MNVIAWLKADPSSLLPTEEKLLYVLDSSFVSASAQISTKAHTQVSVDLGSFSFGSPVTSIGLEATLKFPLAQPKTFLAESFFCSEGRFVHRERQPKESLLAFQQSEQDINWSLEHNGKTERLDLEIELEKKPAALSALMLIPAVRTTYQSSIKEYRGLILASRSANFVRLTHAGDKQSDFKYWKKTQLPARVDLQRFALSITRANRLSHEEQKNFCAGEALQEWTDFFTFEIGFHAPSRQIVEVSGTAPLVGNVRVLLSEVSPG